MDYEKNKALAYLGEVTEQVASEGARLINFEDKFEIEWDQSRSCTSVSPDPPAYKGMKRQIVIEYYLPGNK